MNDSSAFGARVQKRRKELNLTQEDLALKMGYKTKSSINKIEKGLADIPQGKIVPLAEALSTSPAYLMGWTDDENEPLFYAAFSGAGKSDPRVQYYMNLLKNREVNADALSEKEQLLVEYYRAADERTRSIVDLALGIQDVEE